MVTGTSLLSQIPLPTQITQNMQNLATKETEIIASVKVGDIQAPTNNEPKGFWEKLKDKIVEYRMNKIEQKSPEKRTAIEQAEYEANQRIVDCVV